MKHAYPLIAAKLYQEPWCILPSVYASFCGQFEAYISNNPMAERAAADDPVGPSRFNPRTGQTEYHHPQVEKNGNIAVIPIDGVLGKHLSTMDMQCGGYDVGLLASQCQLIGDDDDIDTVVLSINSPGGIAVGISGAAQSILSMSAAGKKVVAYSDSQCASAAYWLACAADAFFSDDSAVVGSISTFCAGVDSSQQWAMAGKQLKLFRTGPLKAIGLPGKAWTEAEEEFMTQRVQGIDAEFKSFCTARRGLDDTQMNGAHWYAKHAPAGLVDGSDMPSLQKLIESLLS